MGQLAPSEQKCARRVPRGDKRRKEIAAVAEQTFLELGFAETTMQIIASRAGASKETLYRHFRSKEGMLSAIMEARAERLTGNSKGEFQLNGEPRQALYEMGHALLSFLSRDENLSLYRIVVNEAPRVPELARIFFEQGPMRSINQLTQYLIEETKHGRLCCSQPWLAAKMFLGAVIACDHLATLMLIKQNQPAEMEIDIHIKEAVAMFLARYQKKNHAEADCLSGPGQ